MIKLSDEIVCSDLQSASFTQAPEDTQVCGPSKFGKNICQHVFVFPNYNLSESVNSTLTGITSKWISNSQGYAFCISARCSFVSLSPKIIDYPPIVTGSLPRQIIPLQKFLKGKLH